MWLRVCTAVRSRSVVQSVSHSASGLKGKSSLRLSLSVCLSTLRLLRHTAGRGEERRGRQSPNPKVSETQRATWGGGGGLVFVVVVAIIAALGESRVRDGGTEGWMWMCTRKRTRNGGGDGRAHRSDRHILTAAWHSETRGGGGKKSKELFLGRSEL